MSLPNDMVDRYFSLIFRPYRNTYLNVCETVTQVVTCVTVQGAILFYQDESEARRRVGTSTMSSLHS